MFYREKSEPVREFFSVRNVLETNFSLSPLFSTVKKTKTKKTKQFTVKKSDSGGDFLSVKNISVTHFPLQVHFFHGKKSKQKQNKIFLQ